MARAANGPVFGRATGV